jgi:hypothetical protein
MVDVLILPVSEITWTLPPPALIWLMGGWLLGEWPCRNGARKPDKKWPQDIKLVFESQI